MLILYEPCKVQLLTYLFTPWNRFFLKELTDSPSDKKFPTFYVTRRFMTGFTSARHTYPYPEPAPSSPCPHISLPKYSSNITLQSMSGSSKWYLSLSFPYQNPEYVSPLPHTCYTPNSSHSSRFYLPNIL